MTTEASSPIMLNIKMLKNGMSPSRWRLSACHIGLETNALDIAADFMESSQSSPVLAADRSPRIFLLMTSAAPSGRA